MKDLYGPNTPLVQRVLDQIPLITDGQAQELGVAWSATRYATWEVAWDAAWEAAWDAARGATRDAARYAAREVAWDAVIALVVHDLVGQYGLKQHHIDTLLAPWISVMGDPREESK